MIRQTLKGAIVNLLHPPLHGGHFKFRLLSFLRDRSLVWESSGQTKQPIRALLVLVLLFKGNCGRFFVQNSSAKV